ncbi:protein lin-54 homolog isoform X1 [Schistocerca gregaria]|uniref:protein lin-54 homolog isoform X1 n=1 Tax=Schistocerca gregaria TaxID=7010 RepID=UPI00211EEE78|nr:protein lin-54 homolog isoform X1 [Schistocerca gregaria]
MPAPDTGGTETPPGARAIVEALGLDAGALADGDLSALTYQHSNDQFNPSEFEALAHFPPELDCLNSTVEVESSLGDALDSAGEVLSVEETVESVEIVTSVHDPNEVPHSPGSILPDIVEEESTDDMDINDMGISDSPEADALQLSSSSHHLASYGNSLAFTSSPMNAKTPQAGSSIVVIQSPVASSTCLTPTSFSQTHVTVSGGQIVGKIAGMSGNVPIGTMPQFQPITQTLVTAKSSDGNIVQLRPTNMNRQAAMTSPTNFTSSALQGIKPLQATVKRPAAATSGQIRNVFAKVIITGNQQNQQGQPVMLTTSQAEGLTTGQPLKIVTSTGQSSTSTLLASPTKAITLAQAQQMGLIQPTRIHSVAPSSPSKNIVVNKFVTSPVKMPAKLVMPASTVVKIPTKILPAPTSMQQSLGGVATVSGATSAVSTVNTSVKPLSPQKVIIRQGSLKPGTVLTSTTGSGQVISIPATQNVMGPAVSIAQVQMPGSRQLQYVRLVSTASGSTSTVASTARASTDGLLSATAVSATTRPLAMSTVRSQPQAVKMVPIAPAAPSVRTVVPKPASGQPAQRILIPAATPVSQLRGAQNVATLQASTVTGAAILPSGGNSYVMLPAHYVEQVKNLQAQQQLNQQKQQEHQMQQEEQQQEQQLQQAHQFQQQQRHHQQAQLQSQKEKTQTQQQESSSANILSSSGSHSQATGPVNTDTPAPPRSGASSRTTLEPNGIRPRKPCNCTKSQCLKLYCDCFANGEFCHMCNCNNCYNNLDHEEDRQRAIKSCLERNPNAFRPKIGKGMVGDERRHNKGCNCKRSGCLKNYCECYEAKIPCSNNCRCIGCRNVEESCDKKSLRDLADAAEVRVQQQTAVKNKLSAHIQDIARPQASTQSGSRHAFNFMTQDVIHATCQCMLAQAEDSERSNNSETQAERLILEEFGRCLVQIIECASKTEASAVQM